MADNKPKPEPSTPAAEEATKATRESIVKSQAGYKGNEHSDLVKVKIIKDGDFYKKGDEDIVHPSLALILKEKGLIADEGTPYTRPKFDQKDITIDV